MKEHSVWLSFMSHVTKRRRALLVESLGGAEGVWEAGEDELLCALPDLKPSELKELCNKDMTEACHVCDKCRDCGADIIEYADPVYPALLREIHDPPTLLYVKGAMPELASRIAIGVVGQRKATVNGMNNARNIAYALSAAGVTVVSGMAAGIDSSSHLGALDGGSPTVAVFGTAIDGCYPASNAGLMRRIIENGAVVSEYPPGYPTHPGLFLSRNRIISGMSRGVLVVEAREKSGSLVTARRAVEQNRDLFAVPGPIGNADHIGTNGLIKDGAIVVTEPADILSWYGYAHVKKDPPVKRRQAAAGSPEPEPELVSPGEPEEIEGPDGELIKAIGKIAHIDDIIERAGMEPGEVMARLTILEVRGLVAQRPGNYYEVTR